ncbi:MAG: hypothetical protein AUF79_14455 [Crenarchaeota archaeon 13_1_20CM_2_51_8]|nr:MAG: hypothetical protein AUF79_14455 [Crenarchaeota archaeon 13_1_20CM_2_51_8]
MSRFRGKIELQAPNRSPSIGPNKKTINIKIAGKTPSTMNRMILPDVPSSRSRRVIDDETT